MSAIMIVWWRVLITSISLLFFIKYKQDILSLPRKRILQYLGIGLLIGLHWLCFYGAIKLANSSIALICAATVAFFTSLLEPIINNRKFDPLELVLGFLVIPGMYIVARNIDIAHLTGLWVGLLAALLAAIFSIYNKRYVNDASPYTINFLEMLSATVLVTLVIPIAGNYSDIGQLLPQRNVDWLYLLLLAVVCTTFTNVIALKALKHLSAFASNLVFNFEPLYGVLLAAFLLKEYEQLTPGFYLGGSRIIIIVLMYPWLKGSIRTRK